MFALIEQQIVERLRARLTGIGVYTEAEVARVPELRQKAPAVFVVYDGYSVIDTTANGRIASIEQSWAVICSAQSASGRGDPATALKEAAEIAFAVMAALLGYHLGGGRYAQLADAPGPTYEGGYCSLPLMFTVRATFRGEG